MEKENLTWEEVSTEHIVQDEWIDFRKSAYRSPDGRIFQPYYSFTNWKFRRYDEYSGGNVNICE